jgi:putative transcriptional regulator
MNFGKALKALREKLVLSQTEMTVLLGTVYVSVNRWENGKHEPAYKVKREILALCRKNNIQVRNNND